MLTPPHRDGGVGAVRVEIRGRLENHRVTKVIGAVSSPSTASAIVTEVLCEMFVKEELNNQVGGVASVCDSTVFLQQIKKKEYVSLNLMAFPKKKINYSRGLANHHELSRLSLPIQSCLQVQFSIPRRDTAPTFWDNCQHRSHIIRI